MIRHLLGGMRHVSTSVAEAAGRPAAQIVVLIAGGAWLADGGDLERLSATVSIGSFVLTQMVLNQQRKREMALQAKLDELILAMGDARNEVVGLEQRTEEEIEELRAEHQDAGGVEAVR